MTLKTELGCFVEIIALTNASEPSSPDQSASQMLAGSEDGGWLPDSSFRGGEWRSMGERRFEKFSLRKYFGEGSYEPLRGTLVFFFFFFFLILVYSTTS